MKKLLVLSVDSTQGIEDYTYNVYVGNEHTIWKCIVNKYVEECDENDSVEGMIQKVIQSCDGGVYIVVYDVTDEVIENECDIEQSVFRKIKDVLQGVDTAIIGDLSMFYSIIDKAEIITL